MIIIEIFNYIGFLEDFFLGALIGYWVSELFNPNAGLRVLLFAMIIGCIGHYISGIIFWINVIDVTHVTEHTFLKTLLIIARIVEFMTAILLSFLFVFSYKFIKK